eukprot:1801060-Amphidinium_carterae.1
MLRELAVAGLELPDLARGLVMLRDSGLSRSEMDTVYNWAQGDFTFGRVVEMLRNLDRIPQTATMATTRVMYAGADDPDGEGAAWAYALDEEDWPPDEAMAEEQGIYAMEEAAGAWEKGEETFSEEQAQVIYAQMQTPPVSRYAQHRREIQGHRLSRGFPGAPPSSKGKGGGGKGKRDRSLQALIQRTRCARCGEIGHWARTCKADSAKSETSTTSASRTPPSAKAYATFFVHSDLPPPLPASASPSDAELDQNVVLSCVMEGDNVSTM